MTHHEGELHVEEHMGHHGHHDPSMEGPVIVSSESIQDGEEALTVIEVMEGQGHNQEVVAETMEHPNMEVIVESHEEVDNHPQIYSKFAYFCHFL